MIPLLLFGVKPSTPFSLWDFFDCFSTLRRRLLNLRLSIKYHCVILMCSRCCLCEHAARASAVLHPWPGRAHPRPDPPPRWVPAHPRGNVHIAASPAVSLHSAIFWCGCGIRGGDSGDTDRAFCHAALHTLLLYHNPAQNLWTFCEHLQILQILW